MTGYCAVINKYYKIADNGLVIYELLPSMEDYLLLFRIYWSYSIIVPQCIGTFTKEK